MKENNRNTTKPSFDYWGIILMLIFILIFLLFVNSYRYFIYALVISGTIFLVRKTSQKSWKEKGENFFNHMEPGLFPFIDAFLYLSFPEMEGIPMDPSGMEGNKSPDLTYESQWEKAYRRVSGYAYVKVSYEYKIAHQSYKNTEQKAERLYYPIWESKDRIQTLKAELQDRSRQQINAQQFILLYNTHSPSESKLFISQPLFYLQGSELYAFSIIIGIIMIVIIMGAISMRKIWNQKRSDEL